MAAQVPAKREGRLGDPTMDLASDPRTNPALLKVLASMGLDHNAPVSPFDASSPFADLTAAMEAQNNGFTQLFGAVPYEIPEDAKNHPVDHSVQRVKGVDGNNIDLHVFRRADAKGQTLPAIYYSHGGGMVILNTMDAPYERWYTSLALTGVAVIAVDFRNGWTKEKHNPFPAGLNDCAAGLKWVAAHKSDLGIGKIILCGESGGGNLAIATALKAKREGWLKAVDGVYAIVPYISNGYGWLDERKAKELPSLLENDGYMLDIKGTSATAFYYSTTKDATNPLAWPYYSSVEDLKGLPPHIIAVDELDPLRDEGLAYYRKLQQAGVDVVGFVNLGITHAASLMFPQVIPAIHKAAVRSIISFAKSL